MFERYLYILSAQRLRVRRCIHTHSVECISFSSRTRPAPGWPTILWTRASRERNRKSERNRERVKTIQININRCTGIVVVALLETNVRAPELRILVERAPSVFRASARGEYGFSSFENATPEQSNKSFCKTSVSIHTTIGNSFYAVRCAATKKKNK